jgi:xanthine/uracil permease
LIKEEAWGKLLGTIMVCIWFEVLVSFLPNKILWRVCPPYVLGFTVMLICVKLTGAEICFWGGGIGCSRNPSKVNLCLRNGKVQLGYGSGPYIGGLGFSIFLIFLLIGIFGSPLMRNTMAIWGLLNGYAIAALALTKKIPLLPLIT